MLRATGHSTPHAVLRHRSRRRSRRPARTSASQLTVQAAKCLHDHHHDHVSPGTSARHGFGDEAQQINKAAASVVRNIGENANRWRPAEKALKFEIAAGEAGESVSAVVSLQDIKLGDAELASRFYSLHGPITAMLTGLIRRRRI